MIFEILAEKTPNDKKIFYYDNEKNVLKDETGFVFVNNELKEKSRFGKESIPFSKDSPIKKSRKVRIIKIQMGLSCNYSCDYCSQKFVERAPETSKKDIDNFMLMLDELEFSEKTGLKDWKLIHRRPLISLTGMVKKYSIL